MPAGVTKELRFRREQAEKPISKAADEHERSRLLREYRSEHSETFEKLLAGDSRGPFWLRKPEIAEIVNEAIHYRDQKEYDLIAHAIMPNHVHIVFGHIPRRDTDEGTEIVRRSDCAASMVTEKAHVRRRDLIEGSGNVCRADCPTYTVTVILRKLKWNTALKANRVLGRTGAFWHDESYDHVIRNAEELDRTIEYVLMNPVKAGLCTDWRNWKWSYVKEGYTGG